MDNEVRVVMLTTFIVMSLLYIMNKVFRGGFLRGPAGEVGEKGRDIDCVALDSVDLFKVISNTHISKEPKYITLILNINNYINDKLYMNSKQFIGMKGIISLIPYIKYDLENKLKKDDAIIKIYKNGIEIYKLSIVEALENENSRTFTNLYLENKDTIKIKINKRRDDICLSYKIMSSESTDYLLFKDLNDDRRL